jgi:hypothetical protein
LWKIVIQESDQNQTSAERTLQNPLVNRNSTNKRSLAMSAAHTEIQPGGRKKAKKNIASGEILISCIKYNMPNTPTNYQRGIASQKLYLWDNFHLELPRLIGLTFTLKPLRPLLKANTHQE